jgi:DNA-binding LacI/PurR family transcriptional regulator
MITLKQIAQQVGVTTSAVSHVLNGREGKLGEKKRESIQNLLQEHRYQRNGLVHALQSKRTHSIGVLLPSVRFTFYAHILEAMEVRARECGYHVFLTQTHSRAEEIRSEINHLRERRVDGVVVVPSQQDVDVYRDLLAAGERVVFIDSYIKGLEVPWVDSDDYAGASMAAKHLLDAGHTRFLILAAVSQDRTPMAIQRLKGFLDTLGNAGIAKSEIRIQRNGLDVDHGYESTSIALKKGGEIFRNSGHDRYECHRSNPRS